MKKSGRILFSLILSFSFCAKIYAQHNPANRFIPPSPNSAALAKFVDIPVNIHTGIPTIAVPVHSWKNEVSGLSLGLSLNYHAGGVKVEELASNVGLGWSLTAGGAITRTVKGRPDEAALGFLNTPVLGNIATPLYSGIGISHPAVLGVAVNVGNSPTDFQTMLDIEANSLDASQDIFYYNFNGKSGKFFIGKDGSILIQSMDNLKISAVSSSPYQITSFEVIDDQGILYVFAVTETTASSINTQNMVNGSSDQNYSNEYVSSWYLSEIKSADRQTAITFEYDGGFQSYESGFSESKAINYTSNLLTGMPVGHIDQHSAFSNMFNVYAQRIKKINFPDGSFVDFVYGARTDISGGFALQQIWINGGGEVFGYQLVQNYFGGRLQLGQLYRFGVGGVMEKPYQFSYYGALPARNSKSQDFWGYPNASSAGTLIPKVFLEYNLGFNPFLDGSDRKPSAEQVKGGSLSKIVYPTGGSTIYEMECNDAYGESSYFMENKVIGPYFFDKSNVNVPYNYDFSDASGNIDMMIKFTEISRIVPEPGEPVWWIEDDVDNTPVNIVLSNASGTWSTILYSGNYYQLKNLGELLITNLGIPSAGIYKVNVQMSTAFLYPVEFNILVSASFKTTFKNTLVGGLRVKRILNYLDANSTVLSSAKRYTYLTEGGQSSGKLAGLPLNGFYHITTRRLEDAWGSPWGEVQLFHRNSESGQPLGSVQGSPVGYSRVVIQDLDGENTPNGKTVYEFSDLMHRGGAGVYPFSGGEYISWGAGLPLRETVYNASGTVQRKVESHYEINVEEHNNANFRSLLTGLVYSSNNNIPGNHDYKQFVSRPEYPFYGISLKQWQKDIQYENGVGLEVLKEFTYDPVYHQSKTITETTSTGAHRTKLYYPYDFSSLTRFAQLTSQNRIAEPVKTEKWRLEGGVEQGIFSAEATDYDIYGGQLRPSGIFQLDVSAGLVSGTHNSSILLFPGSYIPKDVFEVYGPKGAPLTISRPGGAKSSLLWTADGLRPRVLFSNANHDEIYMENFETIGNFHPAHTGNFAYTGSFTPSFVPPNGKNYVLSYWSWDGLNWNFNAPQPYVHPFTLNGIIDNVAIYPYDAVPTKSFTYFSLFGLRDVLEPFQLQRYTYDALGRLSTVSDKNGHITKKFDYNYRP